MNDINPYESPKTLDEKVSHSAVKKGIGVATILLLTPIAVGVALCAGCLAEDLPAFWVAPRWGYGVSIPISLLILFLPPLATLVGMIVWAVRVYRQRQVPGETGSKRDPG